MTYWFINHFGGWTEGPIWPYSSLYSKQNPEQATSSVYSIDFPCIYSCLHFSPEKRGSQILTNRNVTLEVSFLLAYFLEKAHFVIRKLPIMASVRKWWLYLVTPFSKQQWDTISTQLYSQNYILHFCVILSAHYHSLNQDLLIHLEQENLFLSFLVSGIRKDIITIWLLS